MPRWLIRLDELLLAAASGLVPSWGRRFDRWVLLHWPHVWRSRLPVVVWIAVPAMIAAALFAFLTAMDAATALTDVELARAMALPTYLVLIAGAYWVRVVIRFPAGLLRPREMLPAVLANLAAILLIMAPAYVYYQGLSYRIADSISDEDFARERAYHVAHEYWRCSPALGDADAFAAKRAPLAASLHRFGVYAQRESLTLRECKESDLVRTRFSSRPRSRHDCRQQRCFTVAGADMALLRSRISSIRFHKEAWQRLDLMPFSGIHAEHVQLFVSLALVGLVVSSGVLGGRPIRPAGARLRDRLRPLTALAGGRVRLPRILSGIDHLLLLRFPTFWGTRAHWLLAAALAFSGCVVAAVLLLGLGAPRRFDETVHLSVWTLCLLLLIRSFAAPRRYRPVPMTAGQAVGLTAGFLAGAYAWVAIPATMLVVSIHRGWNDDALTWVIFIYGAAIFTQLVLALQVATHLMSGVPRYVVWIGILPAISVVVPFSEELGWLPPMVLCLAGMPVALLGARLMHWRQGVLNAVAALVLVVVPYSTVWIFEHAAAFDRVFAGSMPEGLSRDAARVGGFLAATMAMLFAILVPVVHALGRGRCRPAAG